MVSLPNFTKISHLLHWGRWLFCPVTGRTGFLVRPWVFPTVRSSRLWVSSEDSALLRMCRRTFSRELFPILGRVCYIWRILRWLIKRRFVARVVIRTFRTSSWTSKEDRSSWTRRIFRSCEIKRLRISYKL